MATGKEIKRLRGKKSAIEVANLIGVKVDRLRKWEERDTDPRDTGDIQQIENYFGVPLSELQSLKTFDFVQIPHGTDFKDKYIRSLEEQNKTLREHLNLVSGQLRHLVLMTQAKVQTNQLALADLLVKQKIELETKVEDRLSTDNVENYRKLKAEAGIV